MSPSVFSPVCLGRRSLYLLGVCLVALGAVLGFVATHAAFAALGST